MEVTATVRIDRPAADVFAFVADMANNPSWQKGQQACTWTSEPPLRLGSTYDQHARFLGRDIVSSFEVTEFVPDRRIRIVSKGGTMPIDVTREVTPVDDTTCDVTATVRGEAPMPMRLLGPLLRVLVTSNVRGDYQRLKAILEGNA